MSVVEEYRQQYGFRDWATAYSRLPLSAGQTVLDLGCGLGDQARDLAARGRRLSASMPVPSFSPRLDGKAATTSPITRPS